VQETKKELLKDSEADIFFDEGSFGLRTTIQQVCAAKGSK